MKMVFGFMKQGWRVKPPVSDDIYFRLLENAFFRVHEHRDLPTINLAYGLDPDSEPSEEVVSNSEEVVRAVFQEALHEFKAVESEVKNLEEVRPRSKELLDVHVASVGYLRAFLLYHDRFVAGAAEAVQGRGRQAGKYWKEADEWERSLDEARHRLRDKVAELERNRPDVVIETRLSPSILQDLGLRD